MDTYMYMCIRTCIYSLNSFAVRVPYIVSTGILMPSFEIGGWPELADPTSWTRARGPEPKRLC